MRPDSRKFKTEEEMWRKPEGSNNNGGVIVRFLNEDKKMFWLYIQFNFQNGQHSGMMFINLFFSDLYLNEVF